MERDEYEAFMEFRADQMIAKYGKRNVIPFANWLYEVSPTWSWDWTWQLYVIGLLKRVTDGSIKKLMIFLPPRHGKSELVTVRYPVWRLEVNPELKIIVGAYNQTLANKFSRKSRRIAEEQLELSQSRTAVDDWETKQAGGLRAVGVGGGITGMGGDLILIDDPVKNREEANSPTYRERVWDWYTNDLYTRLEPNGSIILIMTRWHMDDLAGRILDSEDAPNWTVVELPAEAEEDDALNREIGEALCPERFNLVDLADRKRTLGRDYISLYQQRPVPRDGEFFRRSWFQIKDAAPVEARRVRYWDKAGTAGGGAYTAGIRMAMKNGVYYIEDIIRGQWAAAEREKIIRQTAETDGVEVRVWVEQEPGSGGKESAENTIRNLAGYIVKADRVTGDKELRAEPFAAQAEAGNVFLVKDGSKKWNAKFLDEVATFPAGKYKDQVDGASGAFNKLVVAAPTKLYVVGQGPIVKDER